MVEHSFNIQQLPLTLLEETIFALDVEDKITLANTNKYFNSITTSILYKDVIFNHNFPIDAGFIFKDIKVNETAFAQNNENESLNDEQDESERQSELENEKKSSLEAQFRKKLWSKIAPSIKKFNQYIEESKAIDPNNLYNELESYSKLKSYKLNIDTQEGINQLINYTGNRFKYMERLELEVESDLNFEVQDLFPHFAHLRGLELKLNLFQFNIDWLTCFKSDNLTYINVEDYRVTTKFFQIIHENFINLKYLDFKFYFLFWDEDLINLPTFANIVDLKFSIFDECDLEALTYLTDVNYWPSLKNLDANYYKNDDPVVFETNRRNLISLYISIIDPYNLNQWNNLTQLKVLYLCLGNQFSLDLLQTIFTKLTNLNELELAGDILSEYFEFEPKIQLHRLFIQHLDNFGLPFINFIKSLSSLRKLELYFTEKSFVNVDLNEILSGKHTFSNLRTIALDHAPNTLERWFRDNSTVLTKIIRSRNGRFQEHLFL